MAVTPVDILNLGNRRNQQQQGGASVIAPQTDIEEVNRQEQRIQSLNRQVEVGLGSKVDDVMTDREKQLYVDGLSDNDWNLMQKYKSEGYGFMASKTLLENKKKLQDPYQNGTLKYKDYDTKEQYYNKTGVDIDPESGLGKVALFLQKIGFDEQYGNPLNKLATQYNERYANERQAIDTIMEDEEANSLEKIGWWLQRTLMSAESSVINALGNIGNMAQGVADIEQSAVSSALDNAILGLDTDANFYRKEDRRLDEYAWQGIRGGADLLFRAMSPGVMASFTAVGETKTGGEILDLGDKAVRWTVEQGLKLPGIREYYNSLDEQGKEDMLDSLTTGAYMLIMKKAQEGYGKFKTDTKPGQRLTQQETYLKNTRKLFKQSLEEGVKGAKEQISKEGINREVATDLYNGETGKISGRYGPEGEVGIKKEVGRVVQAGLDAFKNTFQEGVRQSNEYNASKRGGTLAKATEVTGTQPTAEQTTTVGKPTVGSKIVDGAKSIWDTTITGLTPEERVRIQNDPFVKEKTGKALAMIQEAGMPMEEAFITEQLYNEIGDKIISVFNQWENKLNETSPVYNSIRNLNTAYDLSASLPELTELLNKNDITVGPGGVLDFSNSKFVSEADMRSVQRVMDMINKDLSGIITPRQYLNLRTKISELAKYTTVDASRGQSLIRQIRHTINETAHKEIPGLVDADKITNKRIKELDELKEGWIYKGGDRKGEIRNNFYSIIKNLTGHNRKVMLQRLEKYYPGVSEEIEAIHLTEKIVRAYNKAPQLIKTLGLSGAVGGGLIQGGLVGTLLGLLAGELISTGFINPVSKTLRKKAINKLINELSPDARRKLEVIAVKQMQAKDLSKEETAVLEKVVEIMAKEQEKFFNEKAIKEREERTKNDQNQLGYHPDVADDKGNVKLGIGKAVSPKKSYKSKKLKQVTEINLKDTDKPADVKVSEIQNELGVDQDVAQEIKTTIDEFLDIIGVDEAGMTNARNVDYTKFSKKALQELLEDKDIPKIEKKKIEQALERAIKDEVLASESDLDREYAYKIHKLQEEEQRIGKVGKNKVGKEYADKQMRDWEKKKEKLIKAMQEDYNLDQFKATDKYAELEAKPIDFINSYTKTKGFRQASAEREILDKLKAGWNSQPTFIRNMDEAQLTQRKNLLDNVELQNGYNMKTEEYNDRYELKENGKIVDRGSIKYGEDGTIEVIAQTMDGLINSGLINYLPDDAVIKISGEDLRATVGDLRASGNEALADYVIGGQRTYKAEDITQETGITQPYHYQKLSKEITPEEKEKGLQIWNDATTLGEGRSAILKRDEARKIFVVQTLQQGYIEALGLNPLEVKKEMEKRPINGNKLQSWQESVNVLAEDEIDSRIGSDLIAQNVQKVINKSALESFVKKVSGTPVSSNDLGEIIKTALAIDSNQDYSLLEYLFMDATDKRLIIDGDVAGGVYFSDTDEIFVSRDFPLTISHETFHYLDYLRGREVSGKYGALSDRSINLSNATPEARQFWRDFTDFVTGLVYQIPDHLANDKTGPNKGIPGMYWSRRTEVFARFGSAFVDRVQRSVNSGPSDEIKGEHGDIFTEEDMADFVNLLQRHSKLKREGKLKDPHDVELKGKSHKEAMADFIQKGLFDEKPELTAFEKYIKDANVDILMKTYDPDAIERKNNLRKKGRNDISMQELYQLNNMIEDHIKERGTEVSSEVGDSTTASLMLSNAEAMKNQKVGTYDKKQIKKIANETEDILKGRGSADYIETLGQLYHPDVDKWQQNLQKIHDIRKGYQNVNVLHTSTLTALKSKIDELSKYSWEDIYDTVPGTLTNAFFRSVKPRIEELKAKGVEDAVTNLVALSNMSVENFEKQMKNFEGKSPMPSIAVMDVNVPHEGFGDLTLVFGRDTVDPKVDPANKIYGSDAWTPMFPTIKKVRKSGKGVLDLNEAFDSQAMEKDFTDIISEFGIPEGKDNIMWSIANDVNHYRLDLTRLQGDELKDKIDQLANKIAYTNFKGFNLHRYGPEPVNSAQFQWKEKNAVYNKVVDKIKEIYTEASNNTEEVIPAHYFKKVANKTLTEKEIGAMRDEIVDRLMLDTDIADMFGREMLTEDIYYFIKDRKKDGQEAITDKIVMEYGADKDEIGDIVDKYFPEISGDRPLTPENVLEAMKKQRINRKVIPGEYKDMIEIEGHQLNDVEDVRRQNFAKVFHGDWIGEHGDLEQRYADMTRTIVDEYMGGDGAPTKEEMKKIKDIQKEIKKAYDTDVDKFKEKLVKKNEARNEVPNDLLKRIIDVVEQGKKIPIRFSESKPERIVDLTKEVEYVLVPTKDKARVEESVKGTPLEGKIVEYTPDNYTAPRSRKMKELQKRYGNVFFSMGGVIMPIAMLYLMMEQEEGQA